MKIYDLIIIGAGPAGITAAIYAARKQMDFMVITEDLGGQTIVTGDIENYTGYQFITGLEFAQKFEEHIKKYKINIRESEEVIDLYKEKDVVNIKTKKADYKAKTVIIASGKRSRELDVVGEKEFKNKGLTYCATCDAPLFSGKDVAVIGGGNSGLDATLQLMNIAKHVYLIDIQDKLRGDAIMQEKIKSSKKVTVFNNTKVTAVLGQNMVNGIKIKRLDEQESVLAVEGIFVEIGLVPNSKFCKDIDKNEAGEIKVDSYNRTSQEAVFAAGDVTDVPEKQIIIAAGEGSKAALSAFRFLAQHNL